MGEALSDGQLGQTKPGQRIALPRPRLKGPMSLEETVARRRSVRHFDREELGLADISQLLWAAQGVTSRAEGGLRSAPSAGACYPLEVYLVCCEGLFHYQPVAQALAKVRGEDLRPALAQAALGQSFIAEAPISLVIAAVYERTTRRYGERGLRYVHIDLGHAAENVHLQAEALGLGSCAVGAFDDAAVAQALGLPRDQRPLYIVPVGRPGPR